MELKEKLQELRKAAGLTQEELAGKLYVSRTAISKWESGRGYPNIDSLKDLAAFFGVTVDELLSSDQLLAVAEEDKRQTKKGFRDLIYGLLDVSIALLLVLPLFAVKSDGVIESVSLINLYGVQPYLKIAYFLVVLSTLLTGVFNLSLQNCTASFWRKIKMPLSLGLSVLLVVLLTVSLQPYASVFAFVLLLIKGLVLIKR